MLIGHRATLVPSAGARAYGMLIALTHSELDGLYGAPGLEQYRPEAFGPYASRLRCSPLCYSLRVEPRLDERNLDYVGRLSP